MVAAVLFALILAMVAIYALFWMIRLAVRSGMDDALRMNKDWLGQRDDTSRR